MGFPTRTRLPAGLIWSGSGDLPAIGARVHIYLNGFGPAEVKACFHADGYLGVLCAPDEMPAWYQRQSPGVTLGHFFNRELEPRQPMLPPAEAALFGSAEAGAVAVDQAPETMDPDPARSPADDWIPEYPPQDH